MCLRHGSRSHTENIGVDKFIQARGIFTISILMRRRHPEKKRAGVENEKDLIPKVTKKIDRMLIHSRTGDSGATDPIRTDSAN